MFKVPFLPPAPAGVGRETDTAAKRTFYFPTLNTNTMKNLKKLPILLALLVTLFTAACSEIDVNPRGDGDDDDTPIIIAPKPKSASAMDTTSLG